MSDEDARAFVQRVGEREWGPMAWRSYLIAGCFRYEGEYGTYAWTRSGAERKARRLMRKYLAKRPGTPVEVKP